MECNQNSYKRALCPFPLSAFHNPERRQPGNEEEHKKTQDQRKPIINNGMKDLLGQIFLRQLPT
jgi:hypothetical protein